ncbi:hypothetical protein [Turicibacter sanguinis]|uniref:hypothetical protein n=1 Tax=Turicibacter sanguinis TaxID=154288 RepID=UPI0012BC777C|nr:hypothetical protein [Turicibacter sanguinis]MDB8436761.1 hypothetical protein [Turicibacter sanguinis]MTO25295.1 hypothetical protein [Turicibacter sanguinis]MTO28200.1 hypothetical protein [Turicibacter sanguinis]MTO91127.1 hypothetical protein [Turicibacter sanguinis]MTP71302.1 hypothetical protein [Turicibacter sanguinis]
MKMMNIIFLILAICILVLGLRNLINPHLGVGLLYIIAAINVFQPSVKDYRNNKNKRSLIFSSLIGLAFLFLGINQLQKLY